MQREGMSSTTYTIEGAAESVHKGPRPLIPSRRANKNGCGHYKDEVEYPDKQHECTSMVKAGVSGPFPPYVIGAESSTEIVALSRLLVHT
jgi:hypothetical protein